MHDQMLRYLEFTQLGKTELQSVQFCINILWLQLTWLQPFLLLNAWLVSGVQLPSLENLHSYSQLSVFVDLLAAWPRLLRPIQKSFATCLISLLILQYVGDWNDSDSLLENSPLKKIGMHATGNWIKSCFFGHSKETN